MGRGQGKGARAEDLEQRWVALDELEIGDWLVSGGYGDRERAGGGSED